MFKSQRAHHFPFIIFPYFYIVLLDSWNDMTTAARLCGLILAMSLIGPASASIPQEKTPHFEPPTPSYDCSDIIGGIWFSGKDGKELKPRPGEVFKRDDIDGLHLGILYEPKYAPSYIAATLRKTNPQQGDPILWGMFTTTDTSKPQQFRMDVARNDAFKFIGRDTEVYLSLEFEYGPHLSCRGDYAFRFDSPQSTR